MLIVGLTGSIASGKSTVAGFLREFGAHVIDWDQVARDVVEPPRPAWQAIVETFGDQVLNPDLTLDRAKLGKLVFNDAEKRKKLNRIVHPAIFDEDERLTAEVVARDPNAIVIKDAPLLIELGMQKRFEKIIVVFASEESQFKRLLGKGLTPEDARSRIASQIPVSEKLQYADYVVENEGSLEDTRRQVEKIYAELSAAARAVK